MTKREINDKYGIIVHFASDDAEMELDRELNTKEIKDYIVHVESFINYVQSDLKY